MSEFDPSASPGRRPKAGHKRGFLLKWTNHAWGFQSRWVVLDGASISYYLTREAAKAQSCRGSIVVENAHVTCAPRSTHNFAVTFGDRSYYFRAASLVEREEWITALLSAQKIASAGGYGGALSALPPLDGGIQSPSSVGSGSGRKSHRRTRSAGGGHNRNGSHGSAQAFGIAIANSHRRTDSNASTSSSFNGLGSSFGSVGIPGIDMEGLSSSDSESGLSESSANTSTTSAAIRVEFCGSASLAASFNEIHKLHQMQVRHAEDLGSKLVSQEIPQGVKEMLQDTAGSMISSSSDFLNALAVHQKKWGRLLRRSARKDREVAEQLTELKRQHAALLASGGGGGGGSGERGGGFSAEAAAKGVAAGYMHTKHRESHYTSAAEESFASAAEDPSDIAKLPPSPAPGTAPVATPPGPSNLPSASQQGWEHDATAAAAQQRDRRSRTNTTPTPPQAPSTPTPTPTRTSTATAAAVAPASPPEAAMKLPPPKPGPNASYAAKLKYLTQLLLDDDNQLKPIVATSGFKDIFREVCNFMDSLGAMFGFVSSDISSKIKSLEVVAKSNPPQYSTCEGLIEYEVKNNLASKGWSGCKCIERLLRALNFTLKLLQDLIEAAPNDSAATVAVAAYQATLSKHHGWFVRKTVETAMYTLPNRDELVSKLCGPGSPKHAQDAVSFACNALVIMCKQLHVPLAKHNLLNL